MSDRFWLKVDRSGECWLWTGAADRKGYGKFSVGPSRDADGRRRNTMVSAHRHSFELANGAIPAGPGFHGTCVLHRCDNPRCVRPDHLFLGTNADNVRDMDRKGRRVTVAPRGDRHGNAVLTEKTVREIASKYRAGGVSQSQLARDYGVCVATVNHIFTGRLWAHLGLAQRGAHS